MRFFFLLFLLSLSSINAFPQTSRPGGGNLGPDINSNVPHHYQGCVKRSNGRIILAESSGKTYQLLSSSVSVDRYLGREVRILASEINPGDPSSAERGIATGESAPDTLDISEISNLAGQCSRPSRR
jgi:hypothetical protein